MILVALIVYLLQQHLQLHVVLIVSVSLWQLSTDYIIHSTDFVGVMGLGLFSVYRIFDEEYAVCDFDCCAISTSCFLGLVWVAYAQH